MAQSVGFLCFVQCLVLGQISEQQVPIKSYGNFVEFEVDYAKSISCFSFICSRRVV